ncbi:PTS transporter subunit EIIC [Pectobacterium brasiliense]|uniref:PTS transporter subunit EIIC n=1 Tax=Pectobacterium brasiliense TaxID=180957 RepID=UPI0005823E37|nr:PTS transporter subunit EIIC [Pectobacterium brasiliense]KHT20198.1 PTS lactose transporter subunit IIC [Pectobacterium brasiliense]
MKYSILANDIIEYVGGKNNIVSVSHCATRLRFTIKDDSHTHQDKIKNLDGVMAVINSGGQFQVVIGQHVSEVFSLIDSTLNNISLSTEENNYKGVNKVKVIPYILDLISGAFTPLLPALCGAGILKSFLTMAILLEWLTEQQPTYKVLFAASNSIFYFLPVFLSVTIGMKLKVNPFVSGAIGAALLEPTFTSLITASTESTFIGISMLPLDYAYNVFPVFVSIFIYAHLEKFLKRIIHQDLQLFLVPMLAMVIVVPLTILFFGPFSTDAGRFIASGITKIIDFNGILSGAFLGATYQFLVALGLHWGLAPIQLENIRTGGDPIGAIGEAASVYTLMGIAIGVWIRSRKEKQLNALSGSAAVTAMLAGVTEPILYGILLRYKRLIPIYIIAGATGGAINGFFNVKMTALVFHNLFSIPAEKPMHFFIIGAFTSLLLGAILTVIFGYEKKMTKSV